MRNFITCHSHPQSLDSASTPAAFAEREVQLGTGYITVTDHGTLQACRTVYDIAKAKKLTPILGLEGYFRDDQCPIILGETGMAPKDYWKYGHVTIHFLDQQAYEVGVRLLSKADERAERHGSERKPLFGWSELEELGAANTTITTGCLIGMVQRHLLDHNNPRMAQKYYERLRSIVRPGHLFVEVFPHICDRNWVQGVFIEVNTGDGLQKLKFHREKWFRTNLGDIKAIELVEEWGRAKKRGEPCKHEFLLAVKNYHTWTEREPARITGIEYIEDFISNECRPWAPDGDVQRGANEFMIWAAKKYGDPILIADDSHFATPDEKIVQDVRLGQSGSWRFYGSYHRQDSQEAFRYFNERLGTSLKDFEGWVDNSYAWAEKFKNFKWDVQPSLPTKFYPSDTLAHTMGLIKKHGRMDWSNEAYKKRLAEEIKLLHHNGTIDLLPYFFIDEEVCSLYERNGMLTGPGRGSAAGLLLTYLLGITHVDPIRYDLSLERFITLDRIKSGKLPDIDQDLPSRDLLVDPESGWLKERFGDHYAQISVDTTLKLKNAIKDVARVFHFGKVPPEIEFVTRKLPNAPQGISDRDFVFGYDAGEGHVLGLIEQPEGKNLKAYIEQYPEEWKVVMKCLGLARQKGRHACAYVIANRPIHEFVPLTTISDVTCTSYTAPAVEAVGGLKMDFLVINSLKDLQDCIKLVQERSGLNIPEQLTINKKRVPRIRLVPMKDANGEWQFHDVWDLPSDQDVFRDIASGKTETVFQFNTPGAVQWLRHFNHKRPNGNPAIDSIEAMSAFTALDRPGPLNVEVTNPEDPERKHNMLVEYARRARGKKPAETLQVFHELFPETFGVMVYQEQLQKAYQHLTGCSGSEAEEFRSNVAKKKMEKVLKAYDHFIERAAEKIGVEQAKGVWEFFLSWGQYGFNKSHSVCYSDLGYACAFLKHHYPLEWWCSVLRNADKKEVNEVFWRYCGHLIDLPDVKFSGSVFEIQGERIRAPLSLLQGVGDGAHEQLVAGAPYTDIDDFCRKVEDYKRSKATKALVKKTKQVKEKKLGPDGKPLREGGKLVYEEREVEVEVEKIKNGLSSINRRVVYTLIVSGAMDSLFPKTIKVGDQEVEATTVDCLQMYEEALARASTPPNAKKATKVMPVSTSFNQLNQITRYQMRKKILPAYSAPLLPMLMERGQENVYIHTDQNGNCRPAYRGKRPIPFVSVEEMDHVNHVSPWPPEHEVTFATACYVESQRNFQFTKDGERHDACSMIFDIDGKRVESVCWPSRGKLPKIFSEKLSGSVVVALFSKYSERPFVLKDLVVAYPPLNEKEEEDKTK